MVRGALNRGGMDVAKHSVASQQYHDQLTLGTHRISHLLKCAQWFGVVPALCLGRTGCPHAAVRGSAHLDARAVYSLAVRGGSATHCGSDWLEELTDCVFAIYMTVLLTPR